MAKAQVAIDFNRDFAAELGRLVAHWAGVESLLAQTLQMLLGIEHQVKARFVYMSVFSVTTKLQLMRRLAENFLTPTPEKAELISLLDEAERLNKLRNDYVHAQWGPSEKVHHLSRWPSSLPGNKSKTFKDIVDVSLDDIRDVVDRIAELSAALIEFQFTSAPKLVEISHWPGSV